MGQINLYILTNLKGAVIEKNVTAGYLKEEYDILRPERYVNNCLVVHKKFRLFRAD